MVGHSFPLQQQDLHLNFEFAVLSLRLKFRAHFCIRIFQKLEQEKWNKNGQTEQDEKVQNVIKMSDRGKENSENEKMEKKKQKEM